MIAEITNSSEKINSQFNTNEGNNNGLECKSVENSQSESEEPKQWKTQRLKDIVKGSYLTSH